MKQKQKQKNYELTPFVRDPHFCFNCRKQTRYICNYCSSLAQHSEIYVCIECAIERKGRLYCPTCNQRLSFLTYDRFIGSFRAMLKKHQNRQHKIFVEPKVHGPDERDNRLPKSEL